MNQVLQAGLAPEVLQSMSQKAQESRRQPGVAITIPSTIARSLDGVLQSVLADRLLDLREKNRNLTSDSLELRIR